MASSIKKKYARFANHSTVYLRKTYAGLPVGYALNVVDNEKRNISGKKYCILVQDILALRMLFIETKYLYQ